MLVCASTALVLTLAGSNEYSKMSGRLPTDKPAGQGTAVAVRARARGRGDGLRPGEGAGLSPSALASLGRAKGRRRPELVHATSTTAAPRGARPDNDKSLKCHGDTDKLLFVTGFHHSGVYMQTSRM